MFTFLFLFFHAYFEFLMVRLIIGFSLHYIWMCKCGYMSRCWIICILKFQNIGIWLKRISTMGVGTWIQPRRKISCVEGYRHDFSCRNIGQTIFRDKSRGIGEKSAILVRNRRFFLDISPGQHGSTESTRYSESQMCYSVPATMHLPQTNCFRGDLNPKPKGLGFSLLAIWANSPL